MGNSIFFKSIGTEDKEIVWDIYIKNNDNIQKIGYIQGKIFNSSEDIKLSELNNIIFKAFKKAKRFKWKNKNLLLIEQFYIYSTFRNKGFSKYILSEVKKFATNNSIDHLLLVAKPLLSYKELLRPDRKYQMDMSKKLHYMYCNNGFFYLNNKDRIMCYNVKQ